VDSSTATTPSPRTALAIAAARSCAWPSSSAGCAT
jgi:hypothetical protein